MNFKTYFYTFLEATEEDVKKIRDAVDKVSDRPFVELFEGKTDRFLIKVYNPKFEKAFNSFGWTTKMWDADKREINGRNYNTWFKQIKSWTNNKIETLLKEILDQAEYAYTSNDYEWNIVSDGFDEFSNIELNPEEARKYFTLTSEKSHLGKYKHTIDKENFLNYAINNLDKMNFSNRDLLQYEKQINAASKLKQAIDQNNIYYYLMFSRHPVDVLRMSDHKGISSCHRLKGSYSKDQGDYADCALADARNDGGIVYLIKGGDAKRILNNLDDQDIFEDKDRNVSGIRPLGRIRLRRFIDLKTGKDFAVPTTLQSEQKYGTFTEEIYEIVLKYCQTHQEIARNPPDTEYAVENLVLVGGSYSDEALEDLLANFLGKYYGAGSIRHKSKHMTTWKEEIDKILSSPNLKTLKIYKITNAEVVSGNKIDFRYEVNMVLPQQAYDKIKLLNKPQSYERDISTMVKMYFDQNQFTIGRSNQTTVSPPSWKEVNGKILVNIKYRTILFDPEEIRSLLSDMFYVEKREQRAGNI